MKYSLNNPEKKASPKLTTALGQLAPLLTEEKGAIAFGLSAIIVTSLLTLTAPIVIGRIVDRFIRTGDFRGVLVFSGFLLVIYAVLALSGYFQTKTMGGVGRRILFRLRNRLFHKLQELPLDFFNQNKAGDLISRLNNDTDQLNQFFAQALIQLLGNLFLIVGAAVFLLVFNIRLGIATLLPAVVVFIVTRLISGWVRARNAQNSAALGALSAEIQESLSNFKAMVAFNRLDYFRAKFAEANTRNFTAATKAGFANGVFMPLYSLASSIGQLIVLCLGIYLITHGQLTIGLLISFILYVNNFYTPLRQMAAFWSSLQQALAGLDRIYALLNLQSDLVVLPPGATQDAAKDTLLEFRNVHFSYENGREVLKDIGLILAPGKTYALVGPTGGGKTTTASLMARLYDPTEGVILFKGRDIRSYTPSERSAAIGFILQEPFLFSGTIRENIIYGNERYLNCTTAELEALLAAKGLAPLLTRFEKGLDTPVAQSGEAISLGQKQLIAFVRVLLREPELLILDEATANIDTVTEALLEDILKRLPPTTTKVIIAHRLNTISAADTIFFVNSATVTRAGSMQEAVDLLLHGKRSS